MGAAALTSWLRQQIAAAGEDTSDEERSRRLESDAEAVQVLTIHRSKGVEFPIVYYPYLWEPGYIPRDPQPVFFHDPQAGDERVIDVGMDGPDFPAHQRQHEAEQRGEDLRLAYVALTRAQHQAVVWWAPSWDSRNSALGRLLFARDAEGNVPPHGSRDAEGRGGRRPVRGARARRVRVRQRRTRDARPGQGVVRRSANGGGSLRGPLRPRPRLALAAHVLQRHHRRRLRGAGGERARGARRRRRGATSAPPAPAPPLDDDLESAAMRGVPSLLAEMPAGVQVGTFVHRVFEATDFAAPDLDAELGEHVAATLARRSVDVGDPATTTAGLRAAIETPLGPLLGGRALRDLERVDRLDELIFELPLVGGDQPTGRLTLAAIAGVLRDHLPKSDPIHGYAERLDDANLRQSLRGYLTGSIDLVVRADDRYAVVDYKTNWLGAPGEDLTAWHHRPAALATEMQHAHYALQALLYTAALHRYLRWRLPGYDPERNLAGVLYLFLRGMVGRDTPTVDGTPAGVFAWRPPSALVVALSDVLDRGDGA